jgi:hypothetical protein
MLLHADGEIRPVLQAAPADDPCPGFQPGIPLARTGDGACDPADQSNHMEVNMAIADADVASRADLLRETALHHGSFEAVAPPHDWWDWYAAYMVAREAGSTSDEAVAAAGRYMAEVKHVVVPSA